MNERCPMCDEQLGRYMLVPELYCQRCGLYYTSELLALAHRTRADAIAEAVREYKERLAMARQFVVLTDKWHRPLITVEWRGASPPSNPDQDKWAVIDEAHNVLTDRGKWEWEPQPSSRTDEFKARTRFSLEVAFTKARALLDKGKGAK